MLFCSVLYLKLFVLFGKLKENFFGNSSKISENSSKILKNSIYRKFHLRALPPKVRKNKPVLKALYSFTQLLELNEICWAGWP